MTKKTTKLLAAAKLIKKDLDDNFIAKEGRHQEISPDCPECKARMLEGFLGWYTDLLEWGEFFDQKNSRPKKNNKTKI